MLRWRIAISVVLIPLLAAVFYADARFGPIAVGLLALCLAVAIRSVWELVDLFRGQFPQLRTWLIMSCVGAVILAAWWPHIADPVGTADSTNLSMVSVVFSIVTMLLMASAAQRFQEPGTHTRTLGAELLIVAYVGLLLSITAQLRWVAGHAAGYLAIGSLVVCVKGGDVGAYALGKLIGGPKMAPILSPKKTWAGFVGGILGAVLFGLLWFWIATPWFLPTQPRPAIWALVFYSMLLGGTGVLGDLCESLLKRDVGQKDSAPLLPGFGGVLDLLDSLLFAGPVAYVLWQVLPMTPWLKS
ncbi:MAG: CDP-archaeol synthase [Planctomycetaceae bacterium]|nr:CDP-archaeol synthase [Planctomycetaceae bacterium]MCB9951510.1 CDP-archaeol synthase [Planctomycetaceae bacterium]